ISAEGCSVSKLREEYERFQKDKEEWKKYPLVGKYFLDQTQRYVHPFRIFGNIWYVGDSWVCVHLIDTGDGLLLIDCGNCGATAMLIQAIWEAGFNPADVKWIVLSHGHLDHIGAAMFFKKMFGTKLYLGKPDAEAFRTCPEKSLIQQCGDLSQDVFDVDYEIDEGDVLTFGNIKMQFYLVPGHTDGCIAAFFDVSDGVRTVRAGYYGGFGFNTLQSDYLDDIGDTDHKMRDVYLKSLAKVRNQKVDLFLGNHCVNNDTLGKAKLLESGCKDNPFINDKLWGEYLDLKRDQLLDLIRNSAS
ncbi:MAG: MBL fold metallo-hydrolase, partial [Spirochaetales bacterium]|nr:MBL fold metallo-hydrolase [Spirochaetales bacterium]